MDPVIDQRLLIHDSLCQIEAQIRIWIIQRAGGVSLGRKRTTGSNSARAGKRQNLLDSQSVNRCVRCCSIPRRQLRLSGQVDASTFEVRIQARIYGRSAGSRGRRQVSVVFPVVAYGFCAEMSADSGDRECRFPVHLLQISGQIGINPNQAREAGRSFRSVWNWLNCTSLLAT